MKLALFVGLGVVCALYVAALAAAVRRALASGEERITPSLFELALGFVTCFFDTLGIGSFAPTTPALKLRNLVPGQKNPRNLNVWHTLPSITPGFIFIDIRAVDIQ